VGSASLSSDGSGLAGEGCLISSSSPLPSTPTRLKKFAFVLGHWFKPDVCSKAMQQEQGIFNTNTEGR